jgi:putative membrane protein
MSENDWPRPGHVLRWFIVTVVILAIIWVALSAFFFFMRPISPFYHPFYRPFLFPFGLLFGIFLIFIIFGALRWVFWPWGWGYRRRHWRYRDESYYILRQRYAKGEITKEQFEQMMHDLQETQK